MTAAQQGGGRSRAQGSALNIVPLNNADNWLHFGLGVGMLLLGLTLTGQHDPTKRSKRRMKVRTWAMESAMPCVTRWADRLETPASPQTDGCSKADGKFSRYENRWQPRKIALL